MDEVRRTSGMSDVGAVTVIGDLERRLAQNLGRFEMDFSINRVKTGTEPSVIIVPKTGPAFRGPGKDIYEQQPTFSPLVRGEQRLAAGEIAELQDYLQSSIFNDLLPGPGDSTRLKRVTAAELNAARERLDSGFQGLSNKNQAIVSKLREDMNEMVDRMLPEGHPWPGARQRFADESSFLGQVGRALGTDAPPDQQTLRVLRNLTTVFNQSNTAKLRLAQRMEEMTGIPFQALLAGRTMAPLIPKGLIGRSAFVGALGFGAGVGAFLAPATLAFTLPSLASSLRGL